MLMLLSIGLVAQTPEYCEEFDQNNGFSTFFNGDYENWINVSGKVGDFYVPGGTGASSPGVAEFEMNFDASHGCPNNQHAGESIAYQIPGEFVEGRRYKIEYKISNVDAGPSGIDGLVEVYLANGLVNAEAQLNPCWGSPNSPQTLINIPNGSQNLVSYKLSYLEEDVRILEFTPNQNFENIWFRCHIHPDMITPDLKDPIDATLVLDYFKVHCGNERYDNAVGSLINEHGEEKDVFCLGERICFDGRGNSGYVRYRYAWTEYNQFGTPINYASSEIFDGQIDDIFCLDEYDWDTVFPWDGGWCPDRFYGFTLSLINECNCWTNINYRFTVECCDDFFDPSFELQANGNGGNVEIQNYFQTNYTSNSTDCPIENTWCIYQSDEEDGDYEIVTSFDGDDFEFEGEKGTFYKVVRRLTTPCGDYCWAEIVFFDHGFQSTGQQEGGVILGQVDCPDDCIPEDPNECRAPEGLCLEFGQTSSTITWDPVPGAVSYTVNFIINDPDCCPGGGFTFPASVSTTDPTFTTGPNLGNFCFSFSVTVICSNGDSFTSGKVCSSDPCPTDCDECEIVMPEITIGSDGCWAYIGFTPAESELCDLSYSLDWGDGSGTSSARPNKWAIHTYTGTGDYEVCITITGVNEEEEECTQEVCETIRINCGEESKDIVDLRNETNTVKEISAEFKFMPNPALDVINIQFEGSWGDKVIMEIHDIQGKLQFSRGLKSGQFGTQSLDVSNLSAGTYVLRIRDELGNAKFQKLIKL